MDMTGHDLTTQSSPQHDPTMTPDDQSLPVYDFLGNDLTAQNIYPGEWPDIPLLHCMYVQADGILNGGRNGSIHRNVRPGTICFGLNVWPDGPFSSSLLLWPARHVLRPVVR